MELCGLCGVLLCDIFVWTLMFNMGKSPRKFLQLPAPHKQMNIAGNTMNTNALGLLCHLLVHVRWNMRKVTQTTISKPLALKLISQRFLKVFPISLSSKSNLTKSQCWIQFTSGLSETWHFPITKSGLSKMVHLGSWNSSDIYDFHTTRSLEYEPTHL